MSVPPVVRRPVRRYLLLCVAAVVGLLGLLGLPESARHAWGFGDQLALHFVLEVCAMVMALMIAVLAWNDTEPQQQDAAKLLLLGFSLVAVLDGLHLLNAVGMPGLVTPSNVEKSQFFWLAARFVAVCTLFLLGLRARLPGHKAGWLAVAVLGGWLLFWMGTYQVQQWWSFQLTGGGLMGSPFGLLELMVCVANFACAALFFLHWQQTRETEPLHLATVCFILGVGELAFLGYFAPSQALFLGGHAFKVLAYGLLYYGIYQMHVRQPLEALRQANQAQQAAQAEWESLWRSIPVEIMVLDAAFHYRKATPVHAQRLGCPVESLLDTHWTAHAGQAQRAAIEPRLKSLVAGKPLEFDMDLRNAEGAEQYLSVTAVPLIKGCGTFDGVAAVFMDVTEKRQAIKQLEDSHKDLNDLRTALDAHAIVAVTDARGIITKVNDKFCQISQYPRGELLGQDHRLLNSGFHAPEFFEQMWKTIAAGDVWTGEICNRAKDGSLYWVHTTLVPFVGEDGMPEQYIAIRANITDRKKAEQRTQTMALYDMLTGLPNRRLLGDSLRMLCANAKHSGRYNAMLLLDLDHFKDVNDSLGHTQGDRLLRQTAERIRNAVREDDVVARLGGDEFVVLLGNLDARYDKACAEAEMVAEKIRHNLEQVFDFEGLMVHTSCSMGIALFQGQGVSQEDIMKQADMALYRAKERGRNQASIFDPSMQEEMLSHANLMLDLRQALDREQLVLYYQTVVDESQQPRGFEALLRWQHPERGLVPPGIFIPKAEQSGLIVGLGRWVLNTACKQLAAWANQPETADFYISVNISARQLRDPDFYALVESVLRSSGANPTLLRLELTESMLHTDLPQTIQKMKKLRQLGVHFSLDDFGTGYSSLSYLKRLPLDELKIDKSFVDDVLLDENAAAIAQAILALAQSLQLSVVAEGIEHIEQFWWLRDQGCHRFQGYHFAKPLPLEKLALPAAASASVDANV